MPPLYRIYPASLDTIMLPLHRAYEMHGKNQKTVAADETTPTTDMDGTDVGDRMGLQSSSSNCDGTESFDRCGRLQHVRAALWN